MYYLGAYIDLLDISPFLPKTCRLYNIIVLLHEKIENVNYRILNGKDLSLIVF